MGEKESGEGTDLGLGGDSICVPPPPGLLGLVSLTRKEKKIYGVSCFVLFFFYKKGGGFVFAGAWSFDREEGRGDYRDIYLSIRLFVRQFFAVSSWRVVVAGGSCRQ